LIDHESFRDEASDVHDAVMRFESDSESDLGFLNGRRDEEDVELAFGNGREGQGQRVSLEFRVAHAWVFIICFLKYFI
jgi:hypothetical protein